MAVSRLSSFHHVGMTNAPAVLETCSSRTRTTRITLTRTRLALRNSFKPLVHPTGVLTRDTRLVVTRSLLDADTFTRSFYWLPISATRLLTVFSGGRVVLIYSVHIIY